MARDLADILTEEGAALLTGDFDRLKSLAGERESLMARGADVALDDAATVRRLAARNMRLAEAAALGVKQAAERLARIDLGASLETYSQQGKRQTFQDSRPNLQRRA